MILTEGAIITATIFASLVAMIKIMVDNSTRRRLIDKGLVSEDIKYLYGNRTEVAVPSSLKWGMVLLGIGLAILIGQLVPEEYHEEITVSGMFIFAGLGLIIFYIVASAKVKKSQQD